MSITLSFSRHARRRGIEGALFSGRAFGYKRQKHQFFSYDSILGALKNNPAAEANPDHVWHPSVTDSQGEKIHDQGKSISSRELRKAMSGYAERLCEKFEREARCEQSNCMKIHDVSCEETRPPLAVFRNKKSFTTLEEAQIRQLLDSKDARAGLFFYPDHELINALEGIKDLKALCDKNPAWLSHDA